MALLGNPGFATVYVFDVLRNKRGRSAVADPEFPRGRQLPSGVRQPIILQTFCQKLKMKEFGRRRGPASLTPLWIRNGSVRVQNSNKTIRDIVAKLDSERKDMLFS